MIKNGLIISNRKSTDNAMAKAKETKGWTMIYKTLYRKLRIEQHESHYKLKVNSVARKDKQFMLHENLTNIAINVQWT
jgi:hypothetical protein